MKVGPPVLLPLIRSRTQGVLMTEVLLAPERRRSVSEIAALVGVSPATAGREVARLEEAGLIATAKHGNTRYIEVLTEHPVYRPLVDLLAVTFGPLTVLRGALSPVMGIEEAVIYGSWAARYLERPGHVPVDVDVLLIGTPDRQELDAATDDVEDQLQRDVNIRTMTRKSWESDDGPYRRTVLDGPLVHLIGSRATLGTSGG